MPNKKKAGRKKAGKKTAGKTDKLKENFNSFSRGKLSLEQDLKILYEYTHPISAARLIMAETNAKYGNDKDKSPRYILAWVGAEQDDVEIYRYFKDKKKAFNQYTATAQKPPPTREDILHDWQQQRVYDWEETQFGHMLSNLGAEQMQRAADKIAEDFNIDRIKISQEKPHGNSHFTYNYYYPGDHSITLEDKHIETLFHEVAHAIDGKANHNKWADHGPSFVRTLITVMDKYLFFDPDKLEASAKEAGLHVAPRDALPGLPKLS